MKKIKSYLYSFLQSQGCYLEKDVFEYGFSIISKYIFYLLLIVPLSFYNHTVIETFIFLFIFISLRQYLGGFHFKNSISCMTFSVIITLIIPFVNTFVPFLNLYIRLIIITFSYIILNSIGIIDHYNKRIGDSDKRKYKKNANLLLFFYSLVLVLFYSNISFRYFNIIIITIIFMSVNLIVPFLFSKNR